jgi:hypothetical protein
MVDLNNHLFAQMERLSNEDLKPEEIKIEAMRATALTSVAKEIIDGGKLMLNAQIELSQTSKGDSAEILGIENKRG